MGRQVCPSGWVGGETGMPESYDGVRAMMEWVGGWGGRYAQVSGWEAGMPENYGERKCNVPGFREFMDKTESISVVWNVKEKRSLILESIHAHCEGASPLTQGIE